MSAAEHVGAGEFEAELLVLERQGHVAAAVVDGPPEPVLGGQPGPKVDDDPVLGGDEHVPARWPPSYQRNQQPDTRLCRTSTPQEEPGSAVAIRSASRAGLVVDAEEPAVADDQGLDAVPAPYAPTKSSSS